MVDPVETREVVGPEYSGKTNIGLSAFSNPGTFGSGLGRRLRKMNPEISGKIIPINYYKDTGKYPFRTYFHWNAYDLVEKQVKHQGFFAKDFDVLMNPKVHGSGRRGSVHGFFDSENIFGSMSYGPRLVVVEVYKDRDNIPEYRGPEEFSAHGLGADVSGGRNVPLKNFKAITSLGGVRRFRYLKLSDLKEIYPKTNDPIQVDLRASYSIFFEFLKSVGLNDLLMGLTEKRAVALAMYSGIVGFSQSRVQEFDLATRLLATVLFGERYSQRLKDLDGLMDVNGVFNNSKLEEFLSSLPKSQLRKLLKEISVTSHNKSDYSMDYGHSRFMIITAIENILAEHSWTLTHSLEHFIHSFFHDGRASNGRDIDKDIEYSIQKNLIEATTQLPREVRAQFVQQVNNHKFISGFNLRVSKLNLDSNPFVASK